MIRIFLFLNLFLFLNANELNYNNSLRIESVPSPYYDFGVCGKEYNITEPDMYEIIMKGVQEYSSEENIAKIKTEVRKIVAKKAVFISNKKYCSNNYSTEWYNDYYKYPENIYNPFGRIIHKKGELALTPSIPNEKNLCFVDGKNKVNLKNQIAYFKKITNGNCIFSVSNSDVRNLWRDFPGTDFYPGSKKIFERFDIQCVPSILHMKGSKIQQEYFSIEQFKRGNL